MLVYNKTNRPQFLKTKDQNILDVIGAKTLTSINTNGEYVHFDNDGSLGEISDYVILVRMGTLSTKIVFKPMTPEELREYMKTYLPGKNIKAIDWIYNSTYHLYYSPYFAFLLNEDPELLKKYWILTTRRIILKKF